MPITDKYLLDMLYTYFWPFVRLAAMFMALPEIGGRGISTRIRLFLTLAITIAIAPVLPQMPFIDPFSIAAVILIFQEILIGVAIGLILKMIFEIYMMSGNIMAMQIGLGFSMLTDPSAGRSVPTLSRLFNVAVVLVFFAINGHLMVIKELVESFYTFPVGINFLKGDDFFAIVKMGGDIFKNALVISLPIMVSLLFVNITFGILARVSPQMNIMSIGFAMTLNFGLLVISIALTSTLGHIPDYLQLGFTTIAKMLGL